MPAKIGKGEDVCNLDKVKFYNNVYSEALAVDEIQHNGFIKKKMNSIEIRNDRVVVCRKLCDVFGINNIKNDNCDIIEKIALDYYNKVILPQFVSIDKCEVSEFFILRNNI